jgi:phage baseplate assembly protein W
MSEIVNNIKTQNWSLSADAQGEIVTDIQDINQCIYLIITTVKGSDPFRSTFGCGLWLHVDKPVNVGIPNMITEIAASIEEWEPRATITNISYELIDSNIIFTIFWTSNFGVSQTELTVTK